MAAATRTGYDQRGFLANILEMEMENLNLTYTLQDEAMGIREVVLIDRGGDGRAPMISVRRVETESGRAHWSGTVRYDTFETRSFDITMPGTDKTAEGEHDEGRK